MQVALQKKPATQVHTPVLRSAAGALSGTRNGLSVNALKIEQVLCREHIGIERAVTKCQNVALGKAGKGAVKEVGVAVNAEGSVGLPVLQGNATCDGQQALIHAPTADVMFISCSGVAKDVLDRCKRAVRTLGNAQLFESEEEAFSTTITHLVIDGHKRSSKLLHAIACGAKIVTPAWLVQCIRWRSWVGCDDFLCQV